MLKYYIAVEGLREMTGQFFRGSKQGVPFKSIGRLENTARAAFDRTQTEVHVDKGKLKASGELRTDYNGEIWAAEIQYAGDPGIYELARGNDPSIKHPQGGHYFLALDLYYDIMEKDIGRAFDDLFDERL